MHNNNNNIRKVIDIDAKEPMLSMLNNKFGMYNTICVLYRIHSVDRSRNVFFSRAVCARNFLNRIGGSRAAVTSVKKKKKKARWDESGVEEFRFVTFYCQEYRLLLGERTTLNSRSEVRVRSCEAGDKINFNDNARSYRPPDDNKLHNRKRKTNS